MVGPELPLQDGGRIEGEESGLVGAGCDVLCGVHSRVRER